MRLATPVIAIVLSAAVSSGCGDSSFGGGGGKKAGVSNQNAGSQDGTGEKGDDGSNLGDDDTITEEVKLPENPNKEQEAIGKCLKAWGSHPFGQSAFTEYRKISASVNILGSGGNAIEDTEITDKPKLIVVSAAVSVLGETNYLLLNPNGWYCFKVDVNVMNQTNVNLQCSAKLADSRVSVNVLSKSSNTAAVGVNVLSTVKVNRIKNEAKDSCL